MNRRYLALAIAVLMAVVAVSAVPYVSDQGSDAESSPADLVKVPVDGEVHFAKGEAFDLSGKDVEFTGNGKYIFEKGSTLILGGPFKVSGAGNTVIVLNEGIFLNLFGIPMEMPSATDLAVDGSVEITIQDSESMLDMGLDISDGGSISFGSGDLVLGAADKGKEMTMTVVTGDSPGIDVSISFGSVILKDVPLVNSDDIFGIEIEDLKAKIHADAFYLDGGVPSLPGDGLKMTANLSIGGISCVMVGSDDVRISGQGISMDMDMDMADPSSVKFNISASMKHASVSSYGQSATIDNVDVVLSTSGSDINIDIKAGSIEIDRGFIPKVSRSNTTIGISGIEAKLGISAEGDISGNLAISSMRVESGSTVTTKADLDGITLDIRPGEDMTYHIEKVYLFSNEDYYINSMECRMTGVETNSNPLAIMGADDATYFSFKTLEVTVDSPRIGIGKITATDLRMESGYNDRITAGKVKFTNTEEVFTDLEIAGCEVEFDGAYLNSLILGEGAKVNGNVFIEDHISTPGKDLQRGSTEYSVNVTLSEGDIVSARMIPVTGYSSISEYPGYGVEYTVNDDGTATVNSFNGNIFADCIPKTYSLTIGDGESEEAEYGSFIDLPTPEPVPGMVFEGWYDGSVTNFGGYYMPARDVVLQEIWVPSITDIQKISDNEYLIDASDVDIISISKESLSDLGNIDTVIVKLRGMTLTTTAYDLQRNSVVGMLYITAFDSESLANAIDGRPAFHITDVYGTVSFTYELKDGESADSVRLYGFTAIGKCIEIPAEVVDLGNGKVGVSTDMNLLDSTLLIEGKSSGSDNTLLYAGIIVAIIVIIVAAYLLVKRRSP